MDAEPNDAELMRRTATGDEPAFRALVERWRDSVARFLQLCTRDLHDAEELAQDVFVRVYRAAPSYTPTARFNTWLFTIARNLCRNWRRARLKRTAQHVPLDEERPEPVADGERPHDALQRKEDEAAIARLLAELPERQRVALTLRAYEAMSYDEIASVLGTSRSAVETLLFRARETMRASMPPGRREK